MSKKEAGKFVEEHDDDDFFGCQDDEDEGFGALGQHEQIAKDEELKTIGYYESYDETKEIRLQEGFEAGYRECFDASQRLGEEFGKMMARCQFGPGNEGTAPVTDIQRSSVTTRLQSFLQEFQSGPNSSEEFNAKESIQSLEKDLFQTPTNG